MRWNPELAEEEGFASGKYVAGEKWRRASQLALALGHIALASGDRVLVETSNGARFGPKRGEAATSQLITFLQAQDARLSVALPNSTTRQTHLNGWLRSFAPSMRNGMVIVISDFLDEGGAADGLNALAAKFDLNVVHTLSNEELEPAFSGDLRFVDIENDGKQDVSLDEATFMRYRERLNAWSTGIAEASRKRGGRYVLVDTSTPVEHIVQQTLRTEGWLV
jgi:uncharacterized protein (DUF58 family)